LSRDFSHFEDFEFEGEWWLPQSADRKTHGKFLFRAGGPMRLELTRSLKNLIDKSEKTIEDPLSQKYVRVFGLSNDGKPCTVTRVTMTKASLSPFGGRCVADVRRLYMGAHFAADQEILFGSQRVELSYVEDWAGINPFRVEGLGTAETVIRIQKEPFRIFRARLKNLGANLEFCLGHSFEYALKGQFAGSRKAWFEILPDKPQSHSWFERVVRQIGDLLTLCVGAPVFPRKISGTIPGGEESKEEKKQRVEIFLRMMDGKEDPNGVPGLMPVPYCKIGQDAPRVVGNWFALQAEIEAVLGLLLGTYYNSHQYVETDFLTLMQALEIFHRRIVGGSYLSAEDWQPHRKTLADAIPDTLAPGHRQSLKKRLEYGFEYSLRKRLQDLLNSLDSQLRGRVTDGFVDLVSECVDTRNALVHEGAGGLQAKGLAELWNANRRLRVFLNVLIWKELGLPVEAFNDEWFQAVG
jgi:hypothetical protein